jgi:AcrR family transcriptional regulator
MELLREKVSILRAEQEALGAAAGSREEVPRSLVDRMWQHLEEPGRIEFAKLLITELPKVPDAARYLFEEFAAPKRELMRKVLEREGTGGRLSQPDAETTAVVIPWMILGVALGLHAFRGIDPSEISYQQVGRAVADVIVKGVGGVNTGAMSP